MSEIEQEERSSTIFNIPIKWHIPDNLQSQYASNVFVQPGQYEIAILFFETRPPLLIGTPEENIAKLKELGAVPAECVARIIVDPDLIPSLIQALQGGLEGYLTSKRNQ